MIFVDTSAFFAILDRDDAVHEAASRVWAALLEDDASFLTSNYVVVECFALIRTRLGMAALRMFHDDVLPVVQLHSITRDDHLNAAQALLTADRRGLSLVDCSSFHVMRSLNLRTAFAFDRHFREQGFDTLPA